MKHVQTIEIIRKLKAKKVKFKHGLSDEAFDDWQEVEDKALFVDDLKQVSLENYIRLKRQKTYFNDRNIRLY